MLNILPFVIPSHIGDQTFSALSVKDRECPFQVIFQNFLSVNFLIILASRIPFWTIVRAVSPASNAGSIDAERVGFKIFLKVYCT